MAIIENGSLKKVEESDIVDGFYSVPQSVTRIVDGAFSGLRNIRKVSMSNSVEILGRSAFSDCVNLEEVGLSENITKIGKSAFQSCRKLKSIRIPKGVTYIDDDTFNGCTDLKYCELQEGLTGIGEYAFCFCSGLETITIPSSVNNVMDSAFFSCKSLKSVTILASNISLGKAVFSSCSSMKMLIIASRNIEFAKSYYNYPNLEAIVITDEDVTININEYKDKFLAVNPMEFIRYDVDKLKSQLASFTFPISLDVAHKLVENKDFTKQQIKFFKQFKMDLENDYYSTNDKISFCRFAYNIGCMSKDMDLNQKANEWLLQLIQNNLRIPVMFRELGGWTTLGENKEFAEFLFGYDVEQKKPTFKQILDNYGNNTNYNIGRFLQRVHEEFMDSSSGLKKGGRFRDPKTNKLQFKILKRRVRENGEENAKVKDYNPTVKVFEAYFDVVKYPGIITKEDEELVNLLGCWLGVTQEDIARALDIMREFYNLNIPTSILGKHLQDLSYIIQKYKEQSEQLAEEGLIEAKEVLDRLGGVAKKEFTFEWLEKNDPMNFLLGLFCHCCALLSGIGYGVMKAAIIHPDVQNLVIKDASRYPIAKGTIYVNREQGYGVFNTFEVSNLIQESSKDRILDEFMTGIRAFAKEYNKQHPDKPLTKISVGMNSNELEVQIRKVNSGFRPCEILQSLDFSQFGLPGQKYKGDWQDEQYLLWENPDNYKEDCHETK